MKSGDTIINDASINPENVAKLIRDMLDPLPPPRGAEPAPRPDARMHYESKDLFVVNLVLKDKRGNEKTTGIIFQRRGLFIWYLTSVRFP